MVAPGMGGRARRASPRLQLEPAAADTRETLGRSCPVHGGLRRAGQVFVGAKLVKTETVSAIVSYFSITATLPVV